MRSTHLGAKRPHQSASFSGRFSHLLKAARLAIAARFFADSFFALAFPPFKPPRRPNTAATDKMFAFAVERAAD
jgi:hypothetical protein